MSLSTVLNLIFEPLAYFVLLGDAACYRVAFTFAECGNETKLYVMYTGHEMDQFQRIT